MSSRNKQIKPRAPRHEELIEATVRHPGSGRHQWSEEKRKKQKLNKELDFELKESKE